jgi:predicted RNA binding protein YcfA (HicA-like mRNA interferase family)
MRIKPMKQKELIREVENKGFVLTKDSRHKTYVKGELVIMIPHSKTVSTGMVHAAFKVLKLVA